MNFRYDGRDYQTKESASAIYNREQYIELPDGRYLFVEDWREVSGELVPQVMEEVDGGAIPARQKLAMAQEI